MAAPTELSMQHLKSLSQRRCAVDITFSNLAYSVKVKGVQGRKQILAGVSGTFRHGRFNCIMGASGSGKSSLLNALYGFNTIVDGDVDINGTVYPASELRRIVSQISSYIMQDDCLVTELTVQETLSYAAKFKFESSVFHSHGQRLVKRVLSATGMKEAANRRVAQISGGQRKRLAVAVELMNYKPVLFLDECTTGLDSSSCYSLMRLLHKLSRQGCNIIATVHQPNSLVYRLFDWLYVLAPGGFTAYEGHPLQVPKALRAVGAECMNHENIANMLFEKGNIEKLKESWASRKLVPESFRLEQQESPKHFESLVENERIPPKVSDKAVPEEIPSLTGEDLLSFCAAERFVSRSANFRNFFVRSIVQARRDKASCIGRYIATASVSILIGSLFYRVGANSTLVVSNSALIFFITNAALAAPALVMVIQADKHLKILIRENINGWYGVAAYYSVRALIEGFFNLTTMPILSVIVFFMSAQPYLEVTLIPSTIILVIQSIATYHLTFILSLFGEPQANFQLPFMLCTIHVVFGGYIVPIYSLDAWCQWIPYISHGAFSFIGVMKSVYSPWDGEEIDLPCSTDIPGLCDRWKTGADVLKWAYIGTKSTPLVEMGIMAVYLVFYVLLGLPLLYLRIRKARRDIARI